MGVRRVSATTDHRDAGGPNLVGGDEIAMPSSPISITSRSCDGMSRLRALEVTSMTRTSVDLPSFPDPSIVADVIRLADVYAAARNVDRPAGRFWTAADLDMQRPTAERDALFSYLETQSDECKAGLFAVYRTGSCVAYTARDAAELYRSSFDLAMQPHHRRYAASDLVGLGRLADGLRRGRSRMGLVVDALVKQDS
jgi:hypothetical protein